MKESHKVKKQKWSLWHWHRLEIGKFDCNLANNIKRSKQIFFVASGKNENTDEVNVAIY